MEQIKSTIFEERINRLAKAATTMTQEQVDACAWAMGGSVCGWTPEGVAEHLTEELKRHQHVYCKK